MDFDPVDYKSLKYCLTTDVPVTYVQHIVSYFFFIFKSTFKFCESRYKSSPKKMFEMLYKILND